MINKFTAIPSLIFAILMAFMFVYKPTLTHGIWTAFFFILNWLLLALYFAYQQRISNSKGSTLFSVQIIIQFAWYFIVSIVFNLVIVGTCVLFGLRFNLDNLAVGLFAYSLLYSLSAALLEEIIFRGLLLSTLLRLLPVPGRVPIAIILQAIPFIFSHSNAWHINGFIVSLVCFSILSGIFAVYTRALWFSIAFHCAWNFSDMVIYGLKYKRLPNYSGIGEFEGNHAIYGAVWLTLLLVGIVGLLQSRYADSFKLILRYQKNRVKNKSGLSLELP